MALVTRWVSALAGASLALGLAGCTTMGSRLDTAAAGGSNTGVQYYLPKKLVSLEIYKSVDGFPFPRYGEIVIGDREFSYLAKLHRAAGADNTLGLGVDPQTRLLSSQSTADSTARGLDIARSLAKSVTALESGGRFAAFDSEIFIGKVVFDPLDPEDVRRANQTLSRTFNAFVDQDCSAFLADVDAGLIDVVNDQYNLELVRECEFFLGLVDQNNSILISVSADPGNAPLTPESPVLGPSILSPADFKRTCSGGLCYRATAPYRFTVTIADRSILDDIVHLPNNQPPLVVRQPAGVFADQSTTIAWVDGTPQAVQAQRNSEVAGFVKLPAEVVEAVSEAVVAGFRRDENEIRAEVDLLNAQAALLREQVALMEVEEDTSEQAREIEDRVDRRAEARERNAETRAGSDSLLVTPGGVPAEDMSAQPPATSVIAP